MKIRTPKPKTGLDEAIESALSELKGYTSTEEGYSAIVEQLEKLYKLKEMEKPERVSRDTQLIVAGNLAGILIIVLHEHSHVITSKAFNLIGKFK